MKDDLKKKLSEMSFHVTQQNGTEPPFRNEFYNHFEKGIYVDIVSGEPLFSSLDKFESDCGWPSFAKPITKLTNKRDTSYGMERIEVRSKEADSHLGHVFNDGPKDLGGLRYCMNSAALRFIPYEELKGTVYEPYLELFQGNKK